MELKDLKHLWYLTKYKDHKWANNFGSIYETVYEGKTYFMQSYYNENKKTREISFNVLDSDNFIVRPFMDFTCKDEEFEILVEILVEVINKLEL